MAFEFAPQIAIVHISDLHFGDRHRFDPPPTPAGDRPKRIGYPTLFQKLSEDWQTPAMGCPVIVCLTGDFTTTASDGEFAEAARFVNDVASANIFGWQMSRSSVFAVPGNHDVLWDRSDELSRMKSWVDFHNDVFATKLTKQEHRQCVKVYDLFDTHGAVILTINSAMHVQKGLPDQDRGNVDLDQLKQIQDELFKVPQDRMGKAIKVALLHHHPVLIPAMAEPGRGYDAVLNAGKLLTILRRFGFHIVLHGHKHNPHVFTEDTRNSFAVTDTRPLLVVAGGSAGSMELPDSPKKSNTYNRILLKWHPAANQTRALVQTRKLTVYESDGTEKLPHDWNWETLDEDDRSFYGAQRLPKPRKPLHRSFENDQDGPQDHNRHGEYSRLRGNLPVLEVLPSLEPRQAYEARMWLVRHERAFTEAPASVTWRAGKKFSVVTIDAADDPTFCAAFSYWGPVLVQATLTFTDGSSETAYLYARMPTTYSDEDVQ